MDYLVALPAQLTQYLRSLRKARGMTQAQLAQFLGVVQSRVADIEANPGAVSVDQLLQIFSVLNAQVLIRDAGVAPKVTAAPSGVRTRLRTDDLPPPQRKVPRQDKNDPSLGQW